MIKSRTTQLIFQSFYCAIGIIGSVACLGVFDNITKLKWDFYVHFTNLSNFLCLGIMFAELVSTAKKKTDSYVKTTPALKFVSLLSIILTFVVFNVLLAPDRKPQLNWRVGSLSFHVVLPIMYIADWILFYEHKKIKWFYPLCSVIFPISYVAFVYVRAAILDFDTSVPHLYPYFFLNLDKQGVDGAVKWVLMLLAAFIIVGYVFYGIDKLIKSKKEA